VIGQMSNSQCIFVNSYVYIPAILLTAFLKHIVNFKQDHCELEHISPVTCHIINVMSCRMLKVFAIGFVTNIVRLYTNINV